MPEWTTIARLLVPITVFLLILTLWYIVVFSFHALHKARKQKLNARIGVASGQSAATEAPRLWREKAEDTNRSAGPGALLTGGRLERLLRNAGVQTAWQKVLGGLLGTMICLFGITYLLSGSWRLALAADVVTLVAARTVIRRRTDRRDALFEVQLADALALAARAIQAGHPVLSAFYMIAENTPSPVGPFFAGICQQQALGISIEESVRTASAGCNSPDLGLFTTSIIIQSRTGGDLSPVLERLALVIRSRIRLSRRVRVLTAQTQFSKRILLALPFIMLLLISLLNPDYMAPLYTSFTGKTLLMAAGASNLLGAWVMNRMAVVRF
ncbi:MAG: type II secretion system F family protein [Planctomycetes bacterium]|nr:type II secretion system F family protein [Planctomycetota bacterium]